MKGQEQVSATAQVLIVQIGNSEPKQIEEMTPEELAKTREALEGKVGDNEQDIEGTAEEVE
jgi:hypothetical protein